MRPDIQLFFQYGTDSDRGALLALARYENLGIGSSVAYIYSLADDLVNYPNKSGHVLYIGEAQRSFEPTGKRFAQHISSGENKGADTGTIYSLSRYYWLGKRIQLQIFILDESMDRKRTERELLNSHVKEFGSLPICQGTTGSNYGTTAMSVYVVPDALSALLLPTSIAPLASPNGMEILSSADSLPVENQLRSV